MQHILTLRLTYGSLEVASMDHVDLVYKVDYLVQSFLSSSLVLTLI